MLLIISFGNTKTNDNCRDVIFLPKKFFGKNFLEILNDFNVRCSNVKQLLSDKSSFHLISVGEIDERSYRFN